MEGELNWIDFRFCKPDVPEDHGATLNEEDLYSGIGDGDPTLADAGGDVEAEWLEFIDDATQVPYYVNTVTGESKWEL